MNFFTIMVIGAIVSTIAVLMTYNSASFLSKKKKMSRDAKFAAVNRRFMLYWDFPLTRQTFRNIHNQILNLSVYTVMEARYTSVKFFERSILSAAAIFILGTVGLGDLVSGIILLFFAVVMLNTSISKRIDDVNFRMLKSISTFLLSLRENYTRLRNIPDALNEADKPPLLKKHIDEIYLMCTATDAEDRLQRFYGVCPHRMIRTLATTCYICNDTGEDSIKDSPFKRGLALVKDECDMEVRRQINQRLMFSTLDKLPFIPLLAHWPIKAFYVSTIPAAGAVFDGQIGFIIKLVVSLVCLCSYYLLSTMNNSSVSATDDRILALADAYGSSRKVRMFANSLVTNKYKKRVKLQKTIDGCLSSKDLGYFYLEKFTFSVIIFVFSIFCSVVMLIASRQSIYNSLASSSMTLSLAYTAEQEKMIRELDAEVLAMDEFPSEDWLLPRLYAIYPRREPTNIQGQQDRLAEKYKDYYNVRFRWWFAFVYIACTIGAWFIPDALLALRAKLVTSEAEMDVLQLQTIIAILMSTPYDTLTVLEWLTKSSDIHKVALSNCYQDYVRDAEKALTILKRKSAVPEFSAMCDKLISTVHQVTLAEAFEDLIAERDNTMKIREVVQLDQLKKKRALASPIALAPSAVWLAMDFVLPLIMIAVKTAQTILPSLSGAM